MFLALNSKFRIVYKIKLMEGLWWINNIIISNQGKMLRRMVMILMNFLVHLNQYYNVQFFSAWQAMDKPKHCCLKGDNARYRSLKCQVYIFLRPL